MTILRLLGLDSRVNTARWADKQFRRFSRKSDNEIIAGLLAARYGTVAPKFYPAAVQAFEEGRITDIFDLCHLIADLELLGHLSFVERMTLTMGGQNIVNHTYRVIDEELTRLGHGRRKCA